MNRKDKMNEKNQENRDPITGEPGSHPVATGAGAVAGGAAGAAAGSVAGPVGTGVGAAAGAVLGGVGGKAAGEKFDPTSSDLDRYLDYTVIDREGNKVGSVDAIWEDRTGQPAYVAVKTGWLGFGNSHVVPAHGAEVSDATRKIRLPYSSEVIKNAPSFESQSDINDDAETRISEYYRQHGYTGSYDATACATGESELGARTTDDDARMTLSREEVNIDKREVEAGGVRLRKIIRTETVNQPVELQREEIVVERVPAKEQTPSRSDIAFREEEVYIPLRREEPVVQKTVRTTEEVRVGKKRETERRDVSETVRREDVDIQRQTDRATPDDRRKTGR
jgi:uncharacterized protein (TIGR02271 family)